MPVLPTAPLGYTSIMNQHASRPHRSPTQAAEGLPRWRWTLAEFERFIELGILTEDDRVELIGGELVPMAAKGIRHENVKGELERWIYRRLPEALRLIVELGWRPDAETYCEPDFLIFPVNLKPFSKVPPAEVLLLIEIADTTLKYDTSSKAHLYAGLGVREYWVVDADTLETRVHREPTGDGYGSVKRLGSSKLLTPLFVPEIAVRLNDMEID